MIIIFFIKNLNRQVSMAKHNIENTVLKCISHKMTVMSCLVYLSYVVQCIFYRENLSPESTYCCS